MARVVTEPNADVLPALGVRFVVSALVVFSGDLDVGIRWPPSVWNGAAGRRADAAEWGRLNVVRGGS